MTAPSEPRCGNCQWWHRDGAALAATVGDPNARTNTGTCHVMPPVIVPTGFGATSYFPIVHESRICSDWVEQYPAVDATNIVAFPQGAA